MFRFPRQCLSLLCGHRQSYKLPFVSGSLGGLCLWACPSWEGTDLSAGDCAVTGVEPSTRGAEDTVMRRQSPRREKSSNCRDYFCFRREDSHRAGFIFLTFVCTCNFSESLQRDLMQICFVPSKRVSVYEGGLRCAVLFP